MIFDYFTVATPWLMVSITRSTEDALLSLSVFTADLAIQNYFLYYVII